MEMENLDQLREAVLQVMRISSFYTDVPGITYDQPDILEYVYSDYGGGALLVRLVGDRVTARVLKGEWSGLPESEDDGSAQELKSMGMLVDPRRALASLTDLSLDKENEQRVLSGRIAIERMIDGNEVAGWRNFGTWLFHLSDEEIIKLFSPKVRFVLDQTNRVTRMNVTVAGWEMEGEVHNLGELLTFFYR